MPSLHLAAPATHEQITAGNPDEGGREEESRVVGSPQEPLAFNNERDIPSRGTPMKHRSAYMLYLVSGIILLVGLSGAFLIYRAAETQSVGASEQGEGALYQLNPEYSKRDLRELELYGGGANVLAYEFRNWFVGLWRGKSLAYIVGGTAILVSVAVFYAADHLRSHGPE
jgi:hypothetical protein